MTIVSPIGPEGIDPFKDFYEDPEEEMDPFTREITSLLQDPDESPDALDALDAFPQGVRHRAGDDLLSDVLDFGKQYIAFPSPSAAVAWCLWVAHTHFIPRLETTPRLAVIAPEKQSGKTRVLEVTASLVPRPMRTVSVTSAVIYRTINKDSPPTLLLDEADTTWSPKGGDERLRALVNAGHRRGTDVSRMNMDGQAPQVETFETFAAIALAGIGNLPDTVMDRSVILRMRRRSTDESVARWRARTCEAEGNLRRQRLEDFANSIDELPLPEDDEEFTDRVADVWEPLFAIADVVGGPWPYMIREACRELTQVEAEELSFGVRLLMDLRTCWPEDADFAGTTDLLDSLKGLQESPWGEGGPLGEKGLTAHRMGRILSGYGIRSGKNISGSTRGYLRQDFEDAWDRYLSSGEASKASRASGGPYKVTDLFHCYVCGVPTRRPCERCDDHYDDEDLLAI